MTISEQELFRAVRDGGEDGIMITKDAWKEFKDRFVIDKYNNSLLIKKKNSRETEGVKSFFDRIKSNASQRGFVNDLPFDIKA